MGIGVDVGATWVHAVALSARGEPTAGLGVEDAVVLPADATGELVAWVQGHGAARVAVDAPSALSALPHADDTTLSPKFRVARCGEIALGRQAHVWVPWVSPAGPPVAPWITAGFGVFDALAAAGLEAVETFPHAAFRMLAGGVKPPAKSSHEGLAARVALLRAAGLVDRSLAVWGHDGLDAAVAAVVAVKPSSYACTCGHDGSAIWLPAPVSAAGGS